MNKEILKISAIVAVAAILTILFVSVGGSQASPDCISRTELLQSNHDSAQRIKEAVIEYIESEQIIWENEVQGK